MHRGRLKKDTHKAEIAQDKFVCFSKVLVNCGVSHHALGVHQSHCVCICGGGGGTFSIGLIRRKKYYPQGERNKIVKYIFVVDARRGSLVAPLCTRRAWI
jgi:hypothetical protein